MLVVVQLCSGAQQTDNSHTEPSTSSRLSPVRASPIAVARMGEVVWRSLVPCVALAQPSTPLRTPDLSVQSECPIRGSVGKEGQDCQSHCPFETTATHLNVREGARPALWNV